MRAARATPSTGSRHQHGQTHSLLLIVACTALVAVAASSAAADPIPITITPPADFGSVLEGQASTPQTLTIQNTGAAAITLNQLTLAGTDPGSFSIPVADDACSNATLNSGDTCDFNVVFNPPSGAGERGVQTSLIDVGDTAGDDAQEVDFSGTAVAPQIDVPGSLPFGSVQLGQSSSQIVTVQNDGQGELDVTTPASPGGDFTVSPTGTTCTGAGAQLTPGDSCNVNVVFTPSATGDENATLVVPSNDPDTPSAQVPVSGTGTQGAVTFDPTSLTFTTHLGTTSPSQTISVQNTGTAPLTIAGPGNGVKINGTNQSNFAVTGDGCTSQTLQVGDSCDVSISFTTTLMAQRTANLQIKDDGAGGTQLAPLSGTGIQSGPVTVTPTSNNFGSVAEGSSSSAQTFTFTNTGGDSVTFPDAPGTFSLTGTNPGDFSTANDGCSGQTIGAGDTCSVDVKFSPPVGAGVRGARGATLSVTGGFVNSPLTVKLTGTAAAPAISVPSTVNFGNVPVGGQPGQQTVTVENNGAGTLTIGQIGAPSGAGFSIVTDGCSNTGLTAGQTCSVVLQFQPSSTGAATGTLQIPHNDPDTTNPVSISLTATGTQVGTGDDLTDVGDVRIGGRGQQLAAEDVHRHQHRHGTPDRAERGPGRQRPEQLHDHDRQLQPFGHHGESRQDVHLQGRVHTGAGRRGAWPPDGHGYRLRDRPTPPGCRSPSGCRARPRLPPSASRPATTSATSRSARPRRTRSR